jgi:hypothetical protein
MNVISMVESPLIEGGESQLVDVLEKKHIIDGYLNT